VLLAIDTDTHMLDHLGFMELGVLTARRAWVAKAGVVNTWPARPLSEWTRRHGR
jgi:DNA polymerase (family 10)